MFFTLLVCDSFLSKLFWSVMSYYPDYILMCLAELECYVRSGGHVIPAHFDTENALWTFLSDYSFFQAGAPFDLRGIVEYPEVL